MGINDGCLKREWPPVSINGMVGEEGHEGPDCFSSGHFVRENCTGYVISFLCHVTLIGGSHAKNGLSRRLVLLLKNRHKISDFWHKFVNPCF